jgi:8-amino-7-oxononanoate synthase
MTKASAELQKGSTGSRLISGNRVELEQAEQKLADFFGFESGLFFNSGYDANLGIFSSIPQKGDVVLYDEHIHASIRDGLRLSLASSYSFKHNDVAGLKRLIEKFNDNVVYVVVEGIYSMHGDIAPIGEIKRLLKGDDKYLIIDEAHSAGTLGDKGVGIVSNDENVYLKLVTFGKAYGAHGSVVLTDEVTRQYLINFARSFIYTTALPPESLTATTKVVSDSSLDGFRRELADKIIYFRSKCPGLDLVSDGSSPIQIIRSEKVSDLITMAESMKQNKIAAKVMLPPTVAKGEECLRVCIHAFNTLEEVDKISSILNNVHA